MNTESPPETIAGYRIHPAANLFPLMSEPELQALADDIKANGQHQPIIYLYTGKRDRWGHEQRVYEPLPDPDKTLILDGRNRLLACEMAGVEPGFGIQGDAFEIDDADPIAYVVSKNLHRRHLTAEQRTAIVLQAATLSGELAKVQADATAREQAGTQASREARGKTAAKLAEQAKVSRATVERVQAATKDNPKALDEIAKGKTTTSKLKPRPATKKADPARDIYQDIADVYRHTAQGKYRRKTTDEQMAAVTCPSPRWPPTEEPGCSRIHSAPLAGVILARANDSDRDDRADRRNP